MSNKSKHKEILFHYTSVETFLKILDNCNNQKVCFWATHAKFFNDPHEYKLAISLLKQSMIKYEKEKNITEKKSVNFNYKSLLRLGHMFGAPFLLSLSENPDDLTMWRTYGSDGNGIAIGIDTKMLFDYSEDKNVNNTKLLPCQYKKSSIIKGLTTYWELLYDKIDFKEDGRGFSMNSFRFLFDLINFCFSFKRGEYQLEKEWRLCKNEHDETKIKFRERNGIIIPYVEHFFDKEIIKKIVIGPCVNKKLTKESIEMLLKSRNYNLPKNLVRISNVPYRKI